MSEDCKLEATPRELEVVTLIAQGLTNKQIAHELSITARTVECHVASICRKLKAANRTEAGVKAVKAGWVK